VLTQTRPCPPPNAGITRVAVSPWVFPVVVVAGAAEAEGLAELFGLKKSANVFFAGEADGLAADAGEAAAFALRPCFAAGEGEASVVVSAAGEVAAVVFALWPRFEGDASAPAAGEALASGDALVAASVFLCDLCLPGDGVGVGD